MKKTKSNREADNVRDFVNNMEKMFVYLKDFKIDWDDLPTTHRVPYLLNKGLIDDIIKLFYINKGRFLEKN